MSIAADIEQFFADRERQVKDFLASRAPDLEKMDEFAQAVVSNPVVGTGLGFLGFTPEAQAKAAEFLKWLDGEFVRIAADSRAAGHDEGVASVQRPEGDVNAEQPAPPEGEAAS